MSEEKLPTLSIDLWLLVIPTINVQCGRNTLTQFKWTSSKNPHTGTRYGVADFIKVIDNDTINKIQTALNRFASNKENIIEQILQKQTKSKTEKWTALSDDDKTAAKKILTFNLTQLYDEINHYKNNAHSNDNPTQNQANQSHQIEPQSQQQQLNTIAVANTMATSDSAQPESSVHEMLAQIQQQLAEVHQKQATLVEDVAKRAIELQPDPLQTTHEDCNDCIQKMEQIQEFEKRINFLESELQALQMTHGDLQDKYKEMKENEIPASIGVNADDDNWCVNFIVRIAQIIDKTMLHKPKQMRSDLILVFDEILYFVDGKAGFALQGSPGANFEINMMPIIIRRKIASPPSDITYNQWKKEYKGMYWKDGNGQTYFDRAWCKSRYEINASLRDYECMEDVPQSETEYIIQVTSDYWCDVIDTTNLESETKKFLDKNPITDKQSRQKYYEWSNKLLKELGLPCRRKPVKGSVQRMDYLHISLRNTEKSTIKSLVMEYIQDNLSTDNVKKTMEKYTKIKPMKPIFDDAYNRYFNSDDGFDRHKQMTQGFIGRNARKGMKYGHLLLEPTIEFAITINQKISTIGGMVLLKSHSKVLGRLHDVFDPQSWKYDISQLRNTCFTIRNLQSDYFSLWVG